MEKYPVIQEAAYLLIADTAGTALAETATKFVAGLLSDRKLTTFQLVNLLRVGVITLLGNSEVACDLQDLADKLEEGILC
jgi:hypothetical protein